MCACLSACKCVFVRACALAACLGLYVNGSKRFVVCGVARYIFRLICFIFGSVFDPCSHNTLIPPFDLINE